MIHLIDLCWLIKATFGGLNYHNRLCRTWNLIIYFCVQVLALRWKAVWVGESLTITLRDSYLCDMHCVAILTTCFRLVGEVANYKDIRFDLEFNEALYNKNARFDTDEASGMWFIN